MMMESEGEVLLTLRRLPNELSDDDCRDLLAAFGAIRCTTVKRNNANKVRVYATFADRKTAEFALSRLHQLQVLGRRLVVEFASDSELPDVDSTMAAPVTAPGSNGEQAEVGSESNAVASEKSSSFRDDVHQFSRNMNAIGRSFGLDYPMSSRLYYSYPRPNATILSNIGGALLAVPKFYNQVLHLMNKMNLPAPFGPTVYFPGLSFVVPDEVSSREVRSEEEESELESEPETTPNERRKDLMSKDPRIRSRARQTLKPKKRARLQLMTAEGGAHALRGGETVSRPEEVFDLPSSQSSKRIEFKLDVKLTAEPNDNIVANDVTRPVEETIALTDDIVSEVAVAAEPEKRKSVDYDELRLNRLSKEEMEALPIFKNYKPGTATRRLYLKNVAKQVDEEDLRAIYGRYAGDETETIEVRLMREGRMKGQAFVTFVGEENARTALDDTNGFVLHGKPIVVQFARCDKDK